MEIYPNHTYKLDVNTVWKSTVTNVAAVRNFEVIADKCDVERICTYT
jgi:hypothetical protein